MISFIGGMYSVAMTAEIIAAIINVGLSHLTSPVQVKVTLAIGALAASTISVTILLRAVSGSRSAAFQG